MIRLGLVFMILLNSILLSAQNPSDKCIKSTEGRDFWFGFLENRPGFSCLVPVAANYVEITATSGFDCKFDIFLGKSTTPYVTDVLQANVPKKIRLDRSRAEPFGSESIEEKAVHLVSDQPLNLYAMNYGYNSVDAAVIFPVEALGNEYYALCYEPHVDVRSSICGPLTNGKNSEFVVVASEDQTRVTITPSKVTDRLKPANVPFTITLNKGELYQVQSMNAPYQEGQGDLTGSYIQSDKPVALYSGSWATTIPNSSVSAWDHLYEQIPPLRSWGRKFVTVPLKTREKDTYRILASVDQTTVRISGKATVMIDRGKFYEFMLNKDEPSLIETDHPVLLAQYSNSNDVDRPPSIPQGGDWDGDPSMLVISPVDETRESVVFVAYDTPEIEGKQFVNVVTLNEAVDQIKLDDGPIAFTPLPNSGYSFAQVEISAGNHRLKSLEAGKGFIAYVYGFGGVESYGYGVGFNLSTRLDLGGDIHFVKDTIVLCRGETKQLDAGAHFANFLWNTGETTQQITVGKEGFYKVTASTADGCVLSDSIQVVEQGPQVNLGNDLFACPGLPMVLDAGSNFVSYLWSDNETTSKIEAKEAGAYSVLVKNVFGCSSRDTVVVSFTDKPKIDLGSWQNRVCGSKATTLNLPAHQGQYLLRSDNPLVVVAGTTVTVPQYGDYRMGLTVQNQNGCTADTSFTIGFHKIPTATISVNDTTCYSPPVQVTYLGDARVDLSRFTWIFANDTVASGIGKDKVQVQLAPGQSNTRLGLKVEENGCAGSAEINQLNVAPFIDFSVKDTLTCERSVVQFSAVSSANIADYHWVWGDGADDYLGKEATHAYQQPGQYDVQLTVVNDKKCSANVQKNKLLFVAPVPAVGFSLDPQTCLEPGNNTLRYEGLATAADRFYWDLTNLKADEVIQSPGSTAGPLVFNLLHQPAAAISLQVVSQYGCRSENKSLIFKRKPIFSLGSDTQAGCVPFQVEFTAKQGDTVDQVDYHWDFGDGDEADGKTVSHTFLQPEQSFDLTVGALSATTGCAATLDAQKYVATYPNPKAGFSVDPAEVYSGRPVTFADQSVNALVVNWNFGDGKVSDEQNPVHTFTKTGLRKVILKAYNQYQCTDIVSKEIVVALSKLFVPNAFSPNAFSQVDRIFQPYAAGIRENGYHLRIMSRWNDVIFECKDEIRGWEGKLSNGSMAQAGNYIWILEFLDFYGKPHRQTGTVMLVY